MACAIVLVHDTVSACKTTWICAYFACSCWLITKLALASSVVHKIIIRTFTGSNSIKISRRNTSNTSLLGTSSTTHDRAWDHDVTRACCNIKIPELITIKTSSLITTGTVMISYSTRKTVSWNLNPTCSIITLTFVVLSLNPSMLACSTDLFAVA